MRSKLLLYAAALLLLWAGCRKMDSVAEPPEERTKEEKFFMNPVPDDPQTASIRLKMQRENNQRPFIDKIISKVGYPRWDKAMVVRQDNGSGRGTTADSSIVYIPFVRDEQQFVNAALVFRLSPTDTSYQYLCDWQYAEYGFEDTDEGWNARDVFHLFARFDKEVFQRTEFLITDGRIFGRPQEEHSMVRVRRADNTGRNNILVPFTICEVDDHCYAPPGQAPCAECTTSCPQYTHTTTSCFTIWVEDGWVPAGGGSGGGGGTGGGGGGGGYPPPECPGVGLRTAVDPCGPGWVPPGGGGVPPPAPEPIDSMLGRYFSKVKPRVDSLMAKSLLNKWEYSMIIVQKGDSIYLRNEKTIMDSLSTVVDFTLSAGEIILGYLHCHPSTSTNANDRSAPSGSDVKALLQKLNKNFVQMTECGNAAYAMVIEDSAKAKRFIDSLARFDLDQRLRDSAMKVAGWFGDWQNATLTALKFVLGQSSKNGIGLYKTTDPMRKSWIKLN